MEIFIRELNRRRQRIDIAFQKVSLNRDMRCMLFPIEV